MRLSIKSIAALIILICILLFTSCNKPNSEKLIGTWKMSFQGNKPPTHDFQITFFKDKTISSKDNGEILSETSKQTYKLTHDEKFIQVLEYNGVINSEFEIQKLTNSELNINSGNGNINKFVKILE